VRTMKKTRSKIISALGIPARSGNVARTIGTAPRNPTHEIITFSLSLMPLKASVRKTLTGRATSIKNSAANRPSPAMGRRCEGKTNSTEEQQNGSRHKNMLDRSHWPFSLNLWPQRLHVWNWPGRF
jgi:hypothetical protein